MNSKIFEFFVNISYIIFEQLLTPPLTPPDNMNKELLSERYVLFAKTIKNQYILTENFSTTNNFVNAQMYSTFAPI